MSNLLAFAQNMIRQNQGNIPNTPWAESAVSAIMNGDSKSGATLANNICQNMGMSREQVLDAAKKQMGIRF